MTSAHPPPRIRDEAGTVTGFVVILTLALMILAGIVIDGGHVLAAKRHAADHAHAAARSGAQAIDHDALHHRRIHITPRAATAAARTYLQRHGLDGTVTVRDDQVRVTVRARQRTPLLALAGISHLTIQEAGEARIARGVRVRET